MGERGDRAGDQAPGGIGVGLAMGAVILVALLTVRQAWIAIVAVSAVIGTWELFGALHRGAGIRLSRVPVLIGGQAMIWLAWPFDTEGILGMKRMEKAINKLESDGYHLRFVSDGYFVFHKEGGWGGST